MLQACLNGGWPRTAHPRVPITPIELASDAVAVREAGADELHIHIRSISGIETLEPTAVANALIAIRAAVPGMPIGIGTGAWISPGGRLRHSHIETWTVCPDYASVNLNEDDAPEVIKLLVRHKVGIEAGLWNRHDAARFASEIQFESCLRVLVEMTSSDADAALQEASEVLAVLDSAGCDLPVLLHGQAGSVWRCVAEAWRLGMSTSVGFEDGSQLLDGAVAFDNAELVRVAIGLQQL